MSLWLLSLSVAQTNLRISPSFSRHHIGLSFHSLIARRTSNLLGSVTTARDSWRTADASFKDLRGAIASPHCCSGSSDCWPTAASHLHRWHKDISASQVLHHTSGLRAILEWDKLQLCGGDVLCLAGEPKECPQGKKLCWLGEQWVSAGGYQRCSVDKDPKAVVHIYPCSSGPAPPLAYV